MKKALVLLPVLAGMVACGKQQAEIDYREKYTGDYEYRVDHDKMNVGADPIWSHETWYYSGYIRIDAGSDDRVLVHWGNDTIYFYDPVITQSNRMIVEQDGELLFPEYPTHAHMQFGPAFIRNDSISLRFQHGGAGSMRIWTITGVKE
jgi:hypothetical protein